MKDKDLFRKTEGILYSYNDLLNDIDLVREDIKIVEEEYKGCTGIQYGEKRSATNKFVSSVEDEIIIKEKELKALKRKLNSMIRLKNRINTAVNKLSGVDRKIIELRYINKSTLGWNQIGRVVKFSEVHCRQRIRPRAIRKMMTTILYGEDKFDYLNL